MISCLEVGLIRRTDPDSGKLRIWVVSCVKSRSKVPKNSEERMENREWHGTWRKAPPSCVLCPILHSPFSIFYSPFFHSPSDVIPRAYIPPL